MEALQEPLPPLATWYVPDMEFPETEPEYVIAAEPTVPNWMAPPCTVPWTLGLPSVERLIVPLRFDPDCCHVRVNVPVKAPLYCPDHFPESPPEAAGVPDAAGLLAGEVGEAGGVDVVDVVPPLGDELHAASISPNAHTRAMPNGLANRASMCLSFSSSFVSDA